MSYSLNGHIEGLDEMKSAFNRSPQTVNKHVTDAIQKTAFFVEGMAKTFAPVRYGFLRGSINTQGPYGSGTDVEAKVGTNMDYAKHQEYGTGIYGKSGTMITPKRAKRLAWKQNGKWVFARAVRGVKGKFYMKRARKEALPFIASQMRSALAQITAALARGK